MIDTEKKLELNFGVEKEEVETEEEEVETEEEETDAEAEVTIPGGLT